MTNTLSLYALLHNYLQHGWNATSITSAVIGVRDMLLPATTNPIEQQVLYPTSHKHQDNTFNITKQDKKRSPHQQHDGRYSLVTPRYRPPRVPIVLCHGLYGFDRMGPDSLPSLQVHYWNGIEKALCDLGAKVIITRVPKTETISNRAYALHSILSSFMSNKELNFIGHSMGGLDCRYLLSHIRNRPYRVSSLTTVCTPHRGSPVTDFFRDNMGLGRPSEAFATDSACMVGDISVVRHRVGVSHSTQPNQQNTWVSTVMCQWFDAPAYNNLTTDYCTQHFNPTTPDDPLVAYYSYTAKSTASYWSSLLGVSGQLIQKVEGDNDGVVSVSSGQWGQHVKTIQDADHWDFTGKSMIPYRTTTNSFDRTAFYVELANHLYEQGH